MGEMTDAELRRLRDEFHDPHLSCNPIAIEAVGLLLKHIDALTLERDRAHDVAFLKGLRAGAKFGVVDTARYDDAVRSLESQIADLKDKP